MKKNSIPIFSFLVVLSFFAVIVLPTNLYSASPWPNLTSSIFGSNNQQADVRKKGNGPPGGQQKGKGRGEKITICHRPPGNPDNEQEIKIARSAWPAHKMHGDKKGPCQILTLQKTIHEPKNIRKFRVNENGELQFLLTEENMQFLDDGNVINSIKKDARAEFLFSVSDTATVMKRDDKNYELFNSEGNLISKGGGLRKSESSVLIGKKFLNDRYIQDDLSQGEIKFFDLSGGTPSLIWDEELFSCKISPPCHYLFQIPNNLNFSKILINQGNSLQRTTLYLVDIFKGEIAAKFQFKNNRRFSTYDHELINDGQFTYIIGRDWSQNRRPLYGFVLDDHLNQIAKVGPEFEYLQAGEILTGSDTTFFVAGSKTLIEKNLVNKTEQKHFFPVDFEAKRMVGDSQEDLIFLSGIDSKIEENMNPVRKVLIYDTAHDTFPKILNFKPNEFGYEKPRWGNPGLSIYEDQNLLIVSNPKGLRFYRYEN